MLLSALETLQGVILVAAAFCPWQRAVPSALPAFPAWRTASAQLGCCHGGCGTRTWPPCSQEGVHRGLTAGTVPVTQGAEQQAAARSCRMPVLSRPAVAQYLLQPACFSTALSPVKAVEPSLVLSCVLPCNRPRATAWLSAGSSLNGRTACVQ